MSTLEFVNLPLTGAGDTTTKVAVDTLADGSVVQVFKLMVSANGSYVIVPADVDGLFVQSIQRAESPQDQLLITISLAAGASIDLDAAAITTGKTGRLMAADVGASVPIRADLQLVNGTRTTRTSIYALKGTEQWKAPSPTFFELAGGPANKFGVHIQNLSPLDASDARVTLYWDEV